MDSISFHQLYEAHARDVYRYALALCGNPSDAEDITMTAFFRAWIGEPLKAGSAKAYLMTIARNLFLDGRRKAWRQQPLQAEHENIQATAAAQETRMQLHETLLALNDLPEQYRAPLQLWAAGGLSYGEIAEAVGVSVPVVKMRIHRARQKLAERTGGR